MINTLMLHYIHKDLLSRTFVEKLNHNACIRFNDKPAFLVQERLDCSIFNIALILFRSHWLLKHFIFWHSLHFRKLFLVLLHDFRIRFQKFHELSLLLSLFIQLGSIFGERIHDSQKCFDFKYITKDKIIFFF